LRIVEDGDVGATRQHVRIYGTVQGVAFRYYCEQQASMQGVAGWVRNADDGSVEAVFEGPAEAVEAMCRWCQSGPSHARVERVETSAEKPRGERGFRIAY
jgi:acylphosphatase